jgi:hypothetical protein
VKQLGALVQQSQSDGISDGMPIRIFGADLRAELLNSDYGHDG